MIRLHPRKGVASEEAASGGGGIQSRRWGRSVSQPDPADSSWTWSPGGSGRDGDGSGGWQQGVRFQQAGWCYVSNKPWGCIIQLSRTHWRSWIYQNQIGLSLLQSKTPGNQICLYLHRDLWSGKVSLSLSICSRTNCTRCTLGVRGGTKKGHRLRIHWHTEFVVQSTQQSEPVHKVQTQEAQEPNYKNKNRRQNISI